MIICNIPKCANCTVYVSSSACRRMPTVVKTLLLSVGGTLSSPFEDKLPLWRTLPF